VIGRPLQVLGRELINAQRRCSGVSSSAAGEREDMHRAGIAVQLGCEREAHAASCAQIANLLPIAGDADTPDCTLPFGSTADIAGPDAGLVPVENHPERS
jgi:hypothetical protein